MHYGELENRECNSTHFMCTSRETSIRHILSPNYDNYVRQAIWIVFLWLGNSTVGEVTFKLGFET